MPIDSTELIEAAEIVARERNMKVALKYTTAASAFTGFTTMGGGILAGPIGLAFGAIFGGLTSAFYTHNKFKSVVEIIREDLTPEQRKMLVAHLEKAVRDVGITDVIQITTLLMTNEGLTLAIFSALQNFLTKDLNHQLRM
uniref:Protein C19orf12 n=1 Tax=Lygus hesperus TaxID=30085 RepID=A0A0A9XEA2_LYGHE